MKQELIDIINNMQQKLVLVIGDLILDKYIFGEVNRISPEAPVPIMKVEKELFVPGGASNVANNLVMLSGKVKVIGIMGSDYAKDVFIRILRENNIDTGSIIIEETRPTIIKVRIMSKKQHLIRADYEETTAIETAVEEEIIKKTGMLMRDVDAVVISDYAKGVITKKVAQYVIRLANEKKIPIIVDPKPKHKEYYHGATIIKPNYKEACEMAARPATNDDMCIDEIGNILKHEMDSNIIITRSEKGITIFEKGKSAKTIASKAVEVSDVTGAGDSVIAGMALALCAGASIEQAAEIGNYAAGIAVKKLGTAAISTQELVEAILKDK